MPDAISYLRWSSKLQTLGDSFRRQISGAEQFALERGLTVIQNFQDAGISGYNGAHRDGALGELLEAVRAGVIKPQTVLLVESIDRLSRENFIDAFSIITSILSAGITIITLEDRQEYTKASLNTGGSAYMLVAHIQRAHAISKSISNRVGEVWQKKKRNAVENKVPLSNTCALWLRRSGNTYELIAERKNIVNYIFEQSAAGHGVFKITAMLNDNKVPTFTRAGQGIKVKADSKEAAEWYTSTVYKILHNRTVLGEYQPRLRNTETKKAAKMNRLLRALGNPHGSVIDAMNIGEPIIGYYPAAITQDLWDRAHAAHVSRKNTGGRIGAKITNLFTGMLSCKHCDGPMVLTNKGTRQYLVCFSAQRHAGCSSRGGIRYSILENTMLKSELWWRRDPIAAPIVDQGEIDRLKALIATDKRRLEMLVSRFGELDDTMMEAMGVVRNRIKANQVVLTHAENKASHTRAKPSLAQINADILASQQAAAKGNYAARLKIRESFRHLGVRIKCDTVDKTSVAMLGDNGFLRLTVGADGSILNHAIWLHGEQAIVREGDFSEDTYISKVGPLTGTEQPKY